MGRSMNTEQAAEYLGYTTSRLKQLRVSGGGPLFIKDVKLVTYDIDDLDQWKAERKRRSTSSSISSSSSAA